MTNESLLKEYYINPIRCRECANRGELEKCPLCTIRTELDGDWVDFFIVDNTDDNFFCKDGCLNDIQD